MITVLSFALLSVSAYAAEGHYYVGGNAGLSLFKDSRVGDSFTGKYDTGSMLSAFMGYDFEKFRVEGEVLLYSKSDFEKVSYAGESAPLSGDASALAGLVNGYVDLYNESDFVTSLMIGAGFSRVEYNDLTIEDLILGSGDDNVFCYQAGIGVGYMISRGFIIDFRYRYFATSDPKFDGAKVDFSSNNFTVGARFYF